MEHKSVKRTVEQLPVRRPTQPTGTLKKIRGVKARKGFSAIQDLLNDRNIR